jgi:hypothetical protein
MKEEAIYFRWDKKARRRLLSADNFLEHFGFSEYVRREPE